jgi:hypothetical protein
MRTRSWFGPAASMFALILVFACPALAFGFVGTWGSGYWENTSAVNGVTATTRTHWATRNVSGTGVPQIHITSVEGIWTSSSQWVKTVKTSVHTDDPNAPRPVDWSSTPRPASVMTGSSYNTFSITENYSGPWCNYMGVGISPVLSGTLDALLTSGKHAIVKAQMGYGRWVIDGLGKSVAAHAVTGSSQVCVWSGLNANDYYQPAFEVDAIGGTWDFSGAYGTSKWATLDHVDLELKYSGTNADTRKHVASPSGNLHWTIKGSALHQTTLPGGQVTRYSVDYHLPSSMTPALLDTTGANSSLQLWTDAYYRDSNGHLVSQPIATTIVLVSAPPM